MFDALVYEDSKLTHAGVRKIQLGEAQDGKLHGMLAIELERIVDERTIEIRVVLQEIGGSAKLAYSGPYTLHPNTTMTIADSRMVFDVELHPSLPPGFRDGKAQS
jgi:hypothetical protein